jgi:hypothetical protein
MSAIGMSITATMVDHWGLQDAIGAATFVLAGFLPSEQCIRERRGQDTGRKEVSAINATTE